MHDTKDKGEITSLLIILSTKFDVALRYRIGIYDLVQEVTLAVIDQNALV